MPYEVLTAVQIHIVNAFSDRSFFYYSHKAIDTPGHLAKSVIDCLNEGIFFTTGNMCKFHLQVITSRVWFTSDRLRVYDSHAIASVHASATHAGV